MNRIRLALLAVAALACAAGVPAETPFRFPDGDAAWTVRLAYAEPAAGPGARVERIDAAQAGGYRRSVLTWSDGRLTENWSPRGGAFTAVEGADGGIVVVPAADTFQTALVVVRYDAGSFGWLQPSLLQGKVSYQGRKCLYYRGAVPSGPRQGSAADPHAEEPSSQAACQAWIDAESLLPVALDDSVRLAAFTFGPPPGEPLVPPKRFLDEINRWQGVLAMPKAFQPPSP